MSSQRERESRRNNYQVEIDQSEEIEKGVWSIQVREGPKEHQHNHHMMEYRTLHCHTSHFHFPIDWKSVTKSTSEDEDYTKDRRFT